MFHNALYKLNFLFCVKQSWFSYFYKKIPTPLLSPLKIWVKRSWIETAVTLRFLKWPWKFHWWFFYKCWKNIENTINIKYDRIFTTVELFGLALMQELSFSCKLLFTISCSGSGFFDGSSTFILSGKHTEFSATFSVAGEEFTSTFCCWRLISSWRTLAFKDNPSIWKKIKKSIKMSDPKLINAS